MKIAKTGCEGENPAKGHYQFLQLVSRPAVPETWGSLYPKRSVERVGIDIGYGATDEECGFLGLNSGLAVRERHRGMADQEGEVA